jgi:predicted secreted acid phosphatase
VAALATLLAIALLATPAAATEPRAPASPEEIVRYHDSGEWDRDTTEATDRARAFLTERLDSGMIARPAIVLDIDDTSLSSYDCLEPVDFDRRAGWPCLRRARMPAIPQTLGLFRYARGREVAVFFITGRHERRRRATVGNLRREGYTGSWTLYTRPRQRARARPGWKARVRRAISRRGYEIVVNVGDQRSDLTGGYALRAFKLPNPMYAF